MYADTFLDREEFNEMFDLTQYEKVRRKYHAEGIRNVKYHGEGIRNVKYHAEGIRNVKYHGEGIRHVKYNAEGIMKRQISRRRY